MYWILDLWNDWEDIRGSVSSVLPQDLKKEPKCIWLASFHCQKVFLHFILSCRGFVKSGSVLYSLWIMRNLLSDPAGCYYSKNLSPWGSNNMSLYKSKDLSCPSYGTIISMFLLLFDTIGKTLCNSDLSGAAQKQKKGCLWISKW